MRVRGSLALLTLCMFALGCSSGRDAASNVTSKSGTTTGAVIATTTPSTASTNTTTTTATVIATPAAPPCRPRQLRVGFDYEGPGAGTNGGSVMYKNVSSTPCQLDGAPTVFARDRHGVPLAKADGGSGPSPPPDGPVVLHHGEIAGAWVAGRNAPPDDAPDSPCHTYRTLVVTMPGDPHSVRALIPAGGPNAGDETLSSCDGIGSLPVRMVSGPPEIPYTPPSFVAF